MTIKKKAILLILPCVVITNVVINILINSMVKLVSGNIGNIDIINLIEFPQVENIFTIRLLLSFLIYLLSLYAFSKEGIANKKINIGQFGSSRFAKLSEIKEQYKEIPDSKDDYEGNGGAIVARHKDKLYIDDDTVNTIILGMTRSGKGELYILPMIDVLSRSMEKPSMIINDMKGELATFTYDTLKRRGYKVHIVNLIDPSQSMKVDLLKPIISAWNKGDKDDAQLMVKAITHTIFPPDEMGDDAFWRDGAVSLVNGFILSLLELIDTDKKIEITFPSITMELTRLVSEKNGLATHFKNLSSQSLGKIEAGTFLSGTDKMQGSFVSIATSKLRNFTLEKFKIMMSRSDLNFEEIGFGDPHAIFLVIPDYDTSNHYIASLVLRQIYDANIKRASKEVDQKTKRRIHFLFDEFGNMPPIADMGAIITAGLSRGLIFHLVLQDFQQLEKKYPNDAGTIKANCGNLLYILSGDPNTLDYISNQCGSITTENYSRSEKDESMSVSIMERPLISPDELRTLKLWETIFLRLSKRSNLKGKPIVSYPIDNRSTTKLIPRFEYLMDDFPTPAKRSLDKLTVDIYRSQIETQTNNNINLKEKGV